MPEQKFKIINAASFEEFITNDDPLSFKTRTIALTADSKELAQKVLVAIGLLDMDDKAAREFKLDVLDAIISDGFIHRTAKVGNELGLSFDDLRPSAQLSFMDMVKRIYPDRIIVEPYEIDAAERYFGKTEQDIKEIQLSLTKFLRSDSKASNEQ